MKYVLMVYGQMTENDEERTIGMQKMAAWYQALGSAVADRGAPFTGAAKTVSDDEVDDRPDEPGPTGYSILEADSLADAVEMARGCPLLKSGRTITLYETFSPM